MKERLLNSSQDVPAQCHILGPFSSQRVPQWRRQAGARRGCAMHLCGSKEQGVMFVILVWFAERFNRAAEMLTLYFGPCV